MNASTLRAAAAHAMQEASDHDYANMLTAIDAAYETGRIDGYESGLKGEDFSDFPTNPDLAHQYEAGFEAGYAKGNRDREGQDFSDFEGTIEALLPR